VLYRRTQTLPVRTLYEALIDYCERNEIDFNRKTPDFKRRDMLIVNKTANEVGFVIDDYNGFTEEKEQELVNMLKTLKNSHNQGLIEMHLKPIKELYYQAMKECDAGNPGMALEVGLSLFADGSPCLADLTRQLLVSAYTRCDRDLFAEIIDAHLKDRRKTLVSRLDLVGGITFASVPTMTGPAYDKTAVGEEPKELSVQDRLEMIKAGVNEPAKPKWEGTKIVKTGTKKFGGFGSGGRRDAMMLAKARKAKEEKLKQEGALQQVAATVAGESAKKERVSKWGAKAGGATDW